MPLSWVPIIAVALASGPAVPTPDRPRVPRVFDAARDGPLELIDELHWTATRPGQDGAFFGFERQPKGWIREAHLHGLFRLADSIEPCAHIQLMTSSHLPSEPSTCGAQARLLISWYLEENGSPAGPNPTREDVDRWWNRRPPPPVPHRR
jgi:hypothetical protein